MRRLLMLLGAVSTSTACISPRGIDDGSEGSVSTQALRALPADGIFSSLIGGAAIPALEAIETPIQFRDILLAQISIFGAAAAFHPSSLDLFGRPAESEARRRCLDGSEALEGSMLNLHRRLTLAYAVGWGMGRAIPQAPSLVRDIFASWGLDYERCPSRPGCNVTDTPWGLAWQLTEEAQLFGSNDGWNADGSLSRQYNRVPFEDWRDVPYAPRNSPWKDTQAKSWQPIREDDGLGFMFHPEHVVPHIGQASRAFFLTDQDLCDATAPMPKYDYHAEALTVLNLTDSLNDHLKAEVELFNNKLTSVLPLQAQFYARQGISLDSFDFILADVAAAAVLYDATILVWKEKVNFDLIRPTTVVRTTLATADVYSYAGPDVGESRWMKGKDWQPYVRVMPHAEYPSGSACACTAFATLMQTIHGTDDVTEPIGGPLVMQALAGSSKIEAGKPVADETFTFSTWSGIAKRCGISRTNGGMHFSTAVPAGAGLCAPVGVLGAKSMLKIATGEKPDYVPILETQREITMRKC